MKTKRLLASVVSAAVVMSTSALPSGVQLFQSSAETYPTVDNTTMEKILAGGRQISGYFASWRANELGEYFTYKDLPWGKMTTINYAFGSVGNWGDGVNAHMFKLKSGGQGPLEYPEKNDGEQSQDYYKRQTQYLNDTYVMRDAQPQLAAPPNYQCFVSDSDRATIKKLVEYKNNVSPKTRIVLSVGGWASSGEFYPMLKAGESAWKEFANTALAICDELEIDGIDLDFEHPSTIGTEDKGGLCGNPQNFDLSETSMDDIGVYQNYTKFVKVVNDTLDAASKNYSLSAAGSASGWVLRGEALSEYTHQLDYINIMSYDFHGAWNEYVWHHAALYDGGDGGKSGDPEIWYASPINYSKIGKAADQWTPNAWYPNYLTVDWAAKYYMGSMPSEKINIGVPYYTRGWAYVDVPATDGTAPLVNSGFGTDANGHLGGTTPPVDKTNGGGVTLSRGAEAIDGLWNDPQPDQPAGANSLYQMKNLLDGKVTAYSQSILKTTWAFTDAEVAGVVAAVKANYDAGTGYKLFRDQKSGNMPYIYNKATNTFITFEDEESIKEKINYVIQNNLGGYMTWEFSGDFAWDAAKNEWVRGATMTTTAAELLAAASAVNKTTKPSDLADYTWNTGTSNGLAYAFSSGIQIEGAQSLWKDSGSNVIEFDFSPTNEAISPMGPYWPFGSFKDDYGTGWTFTKNGNMWHASISISEQWGTRIPYSSVSNPIKCTGTGYGSKVFGVAAIAEDSKVLPVPFAVKNFKVNGKYSKQEFGNVEIALDNGKTLENQIDKSKKNISNSRIDGVLFSYGYTGSAITPSPIVIYTGDGEEKTLTLGTDYTVTYENNVDLSPSGYYAQINILGAGEYTGTAIKSFIIIDPSEVVSGEDTGTTPVPVDTTTTDAPTTTTTTTSPIPTDDKKGDLNSDGNVNTTDLTVMKRIVAKWADYSVAEYMGPGELNKDDAINTSDLTILKRSVAKWTEYLDLDAFYAAQ